VNVEVLDQLLAVTAADGPAELLAAVILEMGHGPVLESSSEGAALKFGSTLSMELGLKRRTPSRP
jgi:hypothetical protein